MRLPALLAWKCVENAKGTRIKPECEPYSRLRFLLNKGKAIAEKYLYLSFFSFLGFQSDEEG